MENELLNVPIVGPGEIRVKRITLAAEVFFPDPEKPPLAANLLLPKGDSFSEVETSSTSSVIRGRMARAGGPAAKRPVPVRPKSGLKDCRPGAGRRGARRTPFSAAVLYRAWTGEWWESEGASV